jgi:RNA-splicing ligase RtcB
MTFIHDTKHNVKVWGLDLIESNTLEQARRTSRLGVVEGVALMPDAHVGIGATVGSVVATRNAIIPAAVGVDIGCGMAAVQFDMKAEKLPDDLSSFMPRVARAIPAGMGQEHGHTSTNASLWLRHNEQRFATPLDNRLRKKALRQFGTLGSGNHFFELALDENDYVWMVLHSGSRGLGNIIGREHIKSTAELRKDAQLEDRDLAWLDEGTDEFAMYVSDMLACQDYAQANRNAMLIRVMGEFRDWMGWNVPVSEPINCHHNFAQAEMHNGRIVWVTRKGAIRAREGELGIIPGSMGASTYIVAGTGSADSYCSCSHGAGRVMSRGQAKRELDAAGLTERMQGKTWNADRAESLVDEHPSAYKPIDAVMQAQQDLVKPLHVLHQVLNYKGV